MNSRTLTFVDRLLSSVDNILRIAAVRPTATRPNPASDQPETLLSEQQRRHVGALMRVNHAGEIAAQGLYHGQALLARNQATAQRLARAAREEGEHLAWCRERLDELSGRPSRLDPLWYTGAFLIGAAAAAIGDRTSLGFVEETEKQVVEHLQGHLRQLPAADRRSRAILEAMARDEARHGDAARDGGAVALPRLVRCAMRGSARIMTRTAYRV